MNPAELMIIGAGSRGFVYADYAKRHPDRLKITGVAEPRDTYRQKMAAEFIIPPERVFTGWEEAAAQAKLADGVIICTQDAMHVQPAVAFAEKGYHILLEKPMAPEEEGCRAITRAVKNAGILFGVCHVLRYTDYTVKLRELINAGAIGEVVSIQHLEPVGYWHQAHSFVRGNWRNTKESSFMLLAKSCHDIDWIRCIMGRKCVAVSSFGSLKHFRKENRPENAADRCCACSIEPECAYSAKKIYLGRLNSGVTGWPVDILADPVTEENITDALRNGPYGRCVYACDNNVVDNQVVIMQFAGGSTASFTMTAFTGAGHRKTTIFGTRGQMSGEGETIRFFDFLTDTETVYDTKTADATILGGHGGGDYRIMEAFTEAVRANDQGKILSGIDETLESHLIVFAAERARLKNRVVRLK